MSQRLCVQHFSRPIENKENQRSENGYICCWGDKAHPKSKVLMVSTNASRYKPYLLTYNKIRKFLYQKK